MDICLRPLLCLQKSEARGHISTLLFSCISCVLEKETRLCHERTKKLIWVQVFYRSIDHPRWNSLQYNLNTFFAVHIESSAPLPKFFLCCSTTDSGILTNKEMHSQSATSKGKWFCSLISYVCAIEMGQGQTRPTPRAQKEGGTLCHRTLRVAQWGLSECTAHHTPARCTLQLPGFCWRGPTWLQRRY